MYELITAFEGRELAEDELTTIMGGQVGAGDPHIMGGGIEVGQLGPGACTVCGSSIGLITISNGGVGPFVSAFNTITFNNGVA